MNVALAIFDLDGVLTDTARHHYLAWKKLAQKIGFQLTEEQNELLKGVSRSDSLLRILEWAGISSDGIPFDEMLEEKNTHYLELIAHMHKGELFQGVEELFKQLKERHIGIALGSSSKNARIILDKLEITQYFDVIIDGNSVSRSKPQPDTFLAASNKFGVQPVNCVVFEDAPAGVMAAKNAGMACIGIGSAEILPDADLCIPAISSFTFELFDSLTS
jgi:beta-phosphoglucomutase